MSEYEEIISQQQDILMIISKTQINTKKCPKVRLTQGYIKTRLEGLESNWRTFRENHLNILKATQKVERSTIDYFSEELYEQCEDIYVNLVADLEDELLKLTKPAPEHSENSHQLEQECNTSNHASHFKLPAINIPTFSGDYNDWNSFHDLFVSLIHQNHSLSDVQKLHYLKTSITGEAEQLLKNVQITNANYDKAWCTLKKRFDNKRLIVHNILHRLVAQKKLQIESAKSLKSLLDITMECLNSLKNLDVSTDSWDPLIVFLITQKFDNDSLRQWEEELSQLESSELPTIAMLEKFLSKRFKVLEMIQNNAAKPVTIKEPMKSKAFHISSEIKCPFCSFGHRLFTCKEFSKLDVSKRYEFVKDKLLCFNCLAPGHSVMLCKQSTSCRRCGKKHHSLLHLSSPLGPSSKTETSSNPTESKNIEPTITSHLATRGQMTLMATALVHVKLGNQVHLLRALVDPCSQESFITESAAQRLQLRRSPIRGHVSGVGQMTTPIKHVAELEIESRLNAAIKLSLSAYVVKKITSITPLKRVNIENLTHLQGLSFADPTFHSPGQIDLLLGANVYTEVLIDGVIKGPPGLPIAQNTHLGWILTGNAEVGDEGKTSSSNIITLHLNVELDNMLRKFWEIEDIASERHSQNSEQSKAEKIYEETVTRGADGRYTVRLPFKTEPAILPTGSREIASRRLSSLEKRLSKDPQLYKEYDNVLQEYLTLNHMELIVHDTPEQRAKAVYLPHHAIVKLDRQTTKVRVVFDASAKGFNGVSLNDQLLVGPPLQEELRDIIMRWRKHKVAFTGDIVKMYRQVRLHSEDADYHRILWRSSPQEPVEEYRLLTVTFGTASAPYLAIKTLKQIAQDEECNYGSSIADIVRQDFYVDDVLTGKDTDSDAIDAQKKLTEMLKSAGFELQKFASNSHTFEEALEPEQRALKSSVNIDKSESIKTLGVIWHVREDKLTVKNKFHEPHCKDTVTKRTVLREIASLFDPLGWLSPAIITAKIFMQKLWLHGKDWDEIVPSQLKDEWLKYRSELPALSKFSIQRWIHTSQDQKVLELHGFSDASMAAYAAVVYARVVLPNEEVKVSLITSKTKVAPLKQVSLPRLELCAASLLCKLLNQVAAAMRVKKQHIFAWSDSMIVLAWINGDPSRWKPFIKNRVVEITESYESHHWFYVNTKENPADFASRGIAPSQLLETEMWWKGPAFLSYSEISAIKPEVPETEEEKRKSVKCCHVISEEDFKLTLLKRYSSLSKLVRVVSYCRRWLLSLKKNKDKRKDLPEYVTYVERNESLTCCIKISQSIEFREELESLKKKGSVKRTSHLLSLTPFLDDQGVLRVGGRLKHAESRLVEKHPIIIGTQNLLLPLILREAHSATLHGGPQMMSYYLRSRYWLIRSTNTIKRFVRSCMICAKLSAKPSTQLMGNLPAVRVKPTRPFLISGVDFAGPINCRMSKGRGSKSFKSYICLFVCMSTKAVHIELVSDMTTDAFIAAFKRFVSRRGHCVEIWSDNGTSFVGAEKKLLHMWKQGKSQIPNELAKSLDDTGTKWRFIPPGAPNFGGLWEAGVKSTKFHLKRIIGDAMLTFEELTTLLTQIEACLNSRPLSKLSDHPNDLEPLTPGHFLVGGPLLTVPDIDLTNQNINRLTRWQLTQRLLQDFWKRWQKEYLSSLQQRSKWNHQSKDFSIGQLVLIKDPRLPPAEWIMGRIVQGYPGSDHLTRTYDIQTKSGIFRRSITKICPLPN
ncbi:hypothetical protein ABMA28_016997 [Loxostege sticticalis]|uniref:Integrase catalytic domain-containing protein n=1 Tax=Loxostege sticticalis TaxID=481309 RepID=A0ABD0T6M5_LOXSC